jgi:hypothetical protein
MGGLSENVVNESFGCSKVKSNVARLVLQENYKKAEIFIA